MTDALDELRRDALSTEAASLRSLEAIAAEPHTAWWEYDLALVAVDWVLRSALPRLLDVAGLPDCSAAARAFGPLRTDLDLVGAGGRLRALCAEISRHDRRLVAVLADFLSRGLEVGDYFESLVPGRSGIRAATSMALAGLDPWGGPRVPLAVVDEPMALLREVTRRTARVVGIAYIEEWSRRAYSSAAEPPPHHEADFESLVFERWRGEHDAVLMAMRAEVYTLIEGAARR